MLDTKLHLFQERNYFFDFYFEIHGFKSPKLAKEKPSVCTKLKKDFFASNCSEVSSASVSNLAAYQGDILNLDKSFFFFNSCTVMQLKGCFFGGMIQIRISDPRSKEPTDPLWTRIHQLL